MEKGREEEPAVGILILLLLLVLTLAETPGQLKAGFDSKAQGIRDGDPGKHCFCTLSQSLYGSLLVTPNWFRNKGTRPALPTVGNSHLNGTESFLAVKKGQILKNSPAFRTG